MTSNEPETQIGRLITEWTANGRYSTPELFELLYRDLRKIAQGYMRKERPDHTLQATALVNEAYLRVFKGEPLSWNDSNHFLCTMAQTMRRILVDHARSHGAHKRGGEDRKVSLEEAFLVSEYRSPDLIAINDALEKLAAIDQRYAHVVDLRFFAGLTIEETAAVLGMSARTVKSDWRFAKAWLQKEIGERVN